MVLLEACVIDVCFIAHGWCDCRECLLGVVTRGSSCLLQNGFVTGGAFRSASPSFLGSFGRAGE